MIKKILVATDASDASDRAVAFAAKMSVTHEAELLILNVIRDMQLPDALRNDPDFESFYNTRDQLMREASDRILKAASEIASREGVMDVQTAIGCGDPATSVSGFARRRKNREIRPCTVQSSHNSLHLLRAFQCHFVFSAEIKYKTWYPPLTNTPIYVCIFKFR